MKLLANPDDRGLRLDVFLAGRIENLTRSQVQLLNRSGSIRINGHHLPTAEFGKPAGTQPEGRGRPTMKPGSFRILVLGP